MQQRIASQGPVNARQTMGNAMMNRMDTLTNEVSSLTASLQGKLDPILRPDQPVSQSNQEATKGEPMPAFFEMAKGMLDKLESSARELDSILNRIEI